MKVLTIDKNNVNSGFYGPQEGFYLSISGPDTLDFLHRLTSQDFKTLEVGSGIKAALLQPTSMILGLFTAYRFKDEILLIPNDQSNHRVVQENLEKFHFAEDLEIQSKQGLFFSSFDEKAIGVFGLLPSTTVSCDEFSLGSEKVMTFGHGNFFSFIAPSQNTGEMLQNKLQEGGVKSLTTENFQSQLLASGFPIWDQDIGTKNLILEGPFEEYVARNKGCYPGQEIVERVFTYGNVAKKLVLIETPSVPQSQTVIKDDSAIGTITSCVSIGDATRCLAMVKKPFFEPGTQVSIDGHQVSVSALPNSFNISREKN